MDDATFWGVLLLAWVAAILPSYLGVAGDVATQGRESNPRWNTIIWTIWGIFLAILLLANNNGAEPIKGIIIELIGATAMAWAWWRQMKDRAP